MRVSTSTRICESILWDKKNLYYDMPESIRMIARAGYRAIDMSFLTYTKGDRAMTQESWRSWVDEVWDTVCECDLEVSQAHAHSFNPLPKHTQQDLEYHEELMLRSIEAAGKMQVKWLTIHPVYVMDDIWFSWKKSMEMNLERYQRYGELASKWNVGIAIENLHGANRVHRFGAGPEDLLELVSRLNSSQFGICWDTGHANLCGIDQVRALQMIGSQLKATHIADNDGQTDQHVAPFFGKIDWKAIMGALKQIGYQGDLAFEIPYFSCGFDDGFHQEALNFSKKLGDYLLTL